ncbi:nuclear pore complex-interacting protein family member A7-like [Nomascus leucogenys]|uniref:nuclear pore complex-interacting protein family member A7-like n=1 Tax=Nomascus leucogenys TaxID=61853 RepID=UPI00122DA8FA|nr:nuclear pore complex-interacting protein family member A7-like [Nomascus leucogenys]
MYVTDPQIYIGKPGGPIAIARKKEKGSSFPGIRIGMEDLYNSQRYREAKVRAEVHKLMTKVNSHYKISGQRKTAKEDLQVAAERLQRRAEDYYRRKIAPSARKPHANWVRMAAVEHHHSSGLPYWPDLTAEALRKRMGRQAPPPTQCHLGADDFVSLKTPPDCLLVPLPPSSVDSLKTPPECLLVPLPPSPVDNFVTPETPPIECRRGPVPSS